MEIDHNNQHYIILYPEKNNIEIFHALQTPRSWLYVTAAISCPCNTHHVDEAKRLTYKM